MRASRAHGSSRRSGGGADSPRLLRCRWYPIVRRGSQRGQTRGPWPYGRWVRSNPNGALDQKLIRYGLFGVAKLREIKLIAVIRKEAPLMSKNRAWPTAVDLFCGAGSASEALKHSHFRVVAASRQRSGRLCDLSSESPACPPLRNRHPKPRSTCCSGRVSQWR